MESIATPTWRPGAGFVDREIPARSPGSWRLDTPAPIVDPGTLWPGLSVLRLRGASAGLPKGTPVLWVMAADNCYPPRAVVTTPRVGGGWGVYLVEAHLLDEYEALGEMSEDWFDFREGWEIGWWANEVDEEISVRIGGKVPTWFGRGVKAGYHDRDRWFATWDRESCTHQLIARSFNDAVRDIFVFDPRRLPAPIGGRY